MKKLSPLLLCVMFSVGLQAAQLPIALGSAGTFSVLGASTVTNTGLTTINGDLGVSPGTAVTGFPPGQVTGGAIHSADGPSGLAQGDLTTAYNDAAGRTVPAIVAGDLGGLTLTPGLYKSTTTLGITGILRLDGQGDVNSVFIFQVGSGLTTASGSQIILQGGAQAANIFWQVGSSATLGTNSIFNGTILAQASITLATGAALNGRALARTAAVTLDTNTVINPGPPTVGVPPPALTVTCPASAAQVGVPYTSLMVATGGTPPYAFSTTGSLSPGLILSASTGAITGTPTLAGTTSFAAKALDSLSVVATKNCSIVTAPAITPPPPLTVSCPASPTQAGVAFSSLLTATGGTPPYTFSITGALPPGLTLSASTGAITGTPTVAGSTSFAANALDSASVAATKNCSLTITPPAPPPLTVGCPASPAQVGVAYNSTLTAGGGTPPYTFSTIGLLPLGLTLSASSGAITGTPTGSGGTTLFSANAQDSASVNATKSCSIVTAPPITPPPTPAPSSLILVLIGFGCLTLYRSRERILGLIRRS